MNRRHPRRPRRMRTFLIPTPRDANGEGRNYSLGDDFKRIKKLMKNAERFIAASDDKELPF